MSKILLLSLFLFFLKDAHSENPFITKGLNFTNKDSVNFQEKKHSPKKASIYSALLPGLGQAYNRKYWKIPIIYAALGTSAYFMITNRDSLRRRQNALNMLLDGDSTTNPAAYYARIPVNILKAQRNQYRTNRDYSIIGLAAFYLINVIDATVDAHFYKFNIDRPLAERKEKKWNIYSSRIGNTQTVGFAWRF